MSHRDHLMHDGPMRDEAGRRRDRRLPRAGRMTRLVALASVAGSLALGAGYAHALPKPASATTQASVLSYQSDWHPFPPTVARVS